MKDFKLPFEWRRFLTGEWTKVMPTRPGTYPIADRLGNHAGYMPVYIYKGVAQSAKEWGGWWWTEPQPSLPRPHEMWSEE